MTDIIVLVRFSSKLDSFLALEYIDWSCVVYVRFGLKPDSLHALQYNDWTSSIGALRS